jgi:hypothetical protein
LKKVLPIQCFIEPHLLLHIHCFPNLIAKTGFWDNVNLQKPKTSYTLNQFKLPFHFGIKESALFLVEIKITLSFFKWKIFQIQ